MTSIISWLDASADEQRKVNEIVRLFSQRETQDEMGGRRIVVALSDALFPGTSVLHSRARYLLFVPWICQMAATRKHPMEAMDRIERQLIDAFKRDESAPAEDRLVGLIGRAAGSAVKQLPSVAYWTALTSWGILEWPGTVPNTLARMKESPGARQDPGSEELADRAARIWHPGVGTAPPGFPVDDIDGGFQLTAAEAQWLSERWAETATGSMLNHLVTAGDHLSVGAPWEHPPCWTSSEKNTALLEHAKWFSLAIGGAQRLYSLLIAEKYHAAGYDAADVDIEWHRSLIAEWEEEVDAERREVSRWDPNELWAEMTARGVATDGRAVRFFSTWFDVLQQGGGSLATDATLRTVVSEREVELKRPAQSRLHNDALLASWRGGVAARTEFRWGSVRQLVNDVIDGLKRSDAGT